MLDNSSAATDEVPIAGGTATVATVLAAEVDADDAAEMTVVVTTLLRVFVGVAMVQKNWSRQDLKQMTCRNCNQKPSVRFLPASKPTAQTTRYGYIGS